MTELELRNLVVTNAKKYIGYKESDGSHKKIIDIYNADKPIPQGYKVKYTDAWCATFVSTVAILSDLTSIMFKECSCPRMITLYKNKGRWKESDSYKPEIGDIVMYDWDDSGAGDNTGTADHVGIVVSVSGNTVKVIEGNMDNAVGYRTLQVNGRYIRGYCLPDYASKAQKSGSKANTTAATTDTPKSEKSATGKNNAQTVKADPAQSFGKVYARTYTVTASSLNMRSGAGMSKSVIKALANGSKVRCYGYYTTNGSTVWLLVQDTTGATGFCSKDYLK